LGQNHRQPASHKADVLSFGVLAGGGLSNSSRFKDSKGAAALEGRHELQKWRPAKCFVLIDPLKCVITQRPYGQGTAVVASAPAACAGVVGEL